MSAPTPTGDTLLTRLDSAERDRSHAPIKVRDAASLLVLDTSGTSARVLMGRRSMRHAFFPGRFVFPGGRVDPSDARVPVATPFAEGTAQKLLAHVPARTGEARARAFAVAAVRETYEETGLLVGRPAGDGAARPSGRTAEVGAWRAFAQRAVAPDLSPLTFLLRAITPPGRPRRYDTRFFVVERSRVADVDESVVGPDAELEALQWLTLEEARALDLPAITHTVVDVLAERLSESPSALGDGAAPVPFFRWRRGRFERLEL